MSCGGGGNTGPARSRASGQRDHYNNTSPDSGVRVELPTRARAGLLEMVSEKYEGRRVRVDKDQGVELRYIIVRLIHPHSTYIHMIHINTHVMSDWLLLPLMYVIVLTLSKSVAHLLKVNACSIALRNRTKLCAIKVVKLILNTQDISIASYPFNLKSEVIHACRYDYDN